MGSEIIFAEAEGRKTEKGMEERVAEGEVGGAKNLNTGPERRNLAKEVENQR